MEKGQSNNKENFENFPDFCERIIFKAWISELSSDFTSKVFALWCKNHKIERKERNFIPQWKGLRGIDTKNNCEQLLGSLWLTILDFYWIS